MKSHWRHWAQNDQQMKQKHFTTQKIKTMSNIDATKNRGLPQVFAKGKQSLPLLRYPHVTHVIKMCLATAICSSEREV